MAETAIASGSGPRWQRARLLEAPRPYQWPDGYSRGTLVWVKVIRPQQSLGRAQDGRFSFLDRAYVLHMRDPRIIEATTRLGLSQRYFVNADLVELLPEFSDAADPDAEVRQ